MPRVLVVMFVCLSLIGSPYGAFTFRLSDEVMGEGVRATFESFTFTRSPYRTGA